MSNRHLFVMDPFNKINPFTDSSYDLMLECLSRGDEIWTCELKHLFIKDGLGFAKARQNNVFSVKNQNEVFHDVICEEVKAFDDFKLIWMRKDPPIDDNYVAALNILNCHARSQTRVINDPEGLLIANEKLWPLKIAAAFMPETVVSADQGVLVAAAMQFEKAVVKPLFQSGGAGVMVFEAHDKNLKSALDLLTDQGKRPAIVQKFIEGAKLGDKRIIIVGGKAVGAVLRVPGGDDHRANLHVGGKAFKTDLTDREKEICHHLEPHLIANGLYFAGIDVINGFLTEVNVTSPTGLQEIDKLDKNTGRSKLRAQLIDWIDENLL